jgi:hypothetical protein
MNIQREAVVASIDGLGAMASSVGLDEDMTYAAAKWCINNGAESVKDIHDTNSSEQMSKDLGLPLVTAGKLINSIKSWPWFRV